MNAHSYRLIFSTTQNRWVPVAESVPSHGKACGTSSAPWGGLGVRPLVLRLRKLWLALALSMGLIGTALATPALPTGGQVVSGTGSIRQTDQVMTVQQDTSKLAINWNSFDIARGNTVIFNQPSASAVALNRVLGGTRSEIYGQLQSNGQVFISNPNGILFGRTAEVNVGGLLATTKSISDADFAAGQYRFTGQGSNGEVINQGNLRASEGGVIALVADQVRNEGNIWADGGSAALAAGGSFNLNLDHDGLTRVTVDSDTLNALVENKGLIAADGGTVALTAYGRDMLQAQVMNLEGIVSARSRNGRSGSVRLDAGSSGTLSIHNARVDLSGFEPEDRGGSFTATGRDIQISGDTSIDARGYRGGGTVLIGGDFQGGGTLAHAQTLMVGEGVRIDASATGEGNGGQVVLWSDGFTDYHGGIKSRGGEVSGNGGRVEVSGKNELRYQAAEATDTRAPHGQWGTLYLDPANISITHGVAGGSTSGTVNGGTGDQGITDGQLMTELETTGVSLTATNTISDAAGVNVTTTNASSALTLNAANINLQGNYSVGGGLVFNVSGTGRSTGYISGTGGITKQGDGRMVMAYTGNPATQTNLLTYTGDTVIEKGVLEFNNVRRVNSTRFQIAAGSEFNVNTSTGFNDPGLTPLNVNATISGAGTFRKSGDGDLYLAFNMNDTGSQVTFDMSAGSQVVVDSGGLFETAAAPTNLADLTVIAGARFGLNDGGVSPDKSYFGALNGAGEIGSRGLNSVAHPRTLVVGNGHASGIFSGQIRDYVTGVTGTTTGSNMQIEKIGTGSQTLTGNNIYTGTTVVSCGTLQVGANGTTGTLGSGAVTTNASLIFNRSDTVALSQMTSCTSAITGTGDFKALIGGDFTLDRSVSLTGTQSQIWLEAGKNQAAGDATGGDILVSAGSTLAAPAGGTLVVFSGHNNTAAIEGAFTGATGTTRYKTYNASEASLTTAPTAVRTGTRNYYYRQKPELAATGNVSASKTYDGNTDIVGTLNTTGVSTGGYVDGDSGAGAITFNTAGVHYLGANVGTNVGLSALAVSGNTSWNYTAGAVTWNVTGYGVADNTNKTGVITPRTVYVNLSAPTGKTYDGTTGNVGAMTQNWQPTNTGLSQGLVGTETLNFTYNASYADKHANASVGIDLANVAIANGTNGGQAGNYLVIYDATGAAPDVNLTGTGAATALTNVTTAAITPRDLTIQLNNITKVYDGDDVAAANGAVARPNTSAHDGLVAGDAIDSVTGDGSYNSAHVLDANVASFNASNLSLGFNASLASDYNITVLDPQQATITPKPISVTGSVTADNKTYDGTRDAVVNASGLNFTGLVGNETLSVVGTAVTGQFDRADVGTQNVSLNMTGAVSNGTGRVSDYDIGEIPTSAQADIWAREVHVNLSSAASRVYDGTTDDVGVMVQNWQAQDNILAQGLVGNQSLTMSYDARYVSSDANASVGINLANVAIADGANDGQVSNYRVIYDTPGASLGVNLTGTGAASTVEQASSGTIARAPLTVTAQPDSRNYDGTTRSSKTPQCTGAINGESCEGLSQAFTSVGPGTVPIRGALTGIANGSLHNYDITYVDAQGQIVALASTPVDVPVFVAITPPDRNRPQRAIEETVSRSADQDRIVVTESPESVLLASAYTYGDPWRAAELAGAAADISGSDTGTGRASGAGQGGRGAAAQTDESTAARRSGQPGYARPESGIFCVEGAIRVPHGLYSYGVSRCTKDTG
jgi:filamentous hemagglutinin family protein